MKRRRKARARKWAPRSTGKKDKAVSCRIPERVHAALAQAAERRGWTVSAEIAHRLEDSLTTPATPTQALMATIGYVLDGLRSQGNATWLTDPHLHQEAHAAVAAAFRLVQPKGYPPKPDKEIPDVARPSGRIGFELYWDEIRTFGPKSEIAPKKPLRRLVHERRLAALREGLSTLPDRVVLWGKTGREARRFVSALSVAELSEFARLSRKRIVHGLTEEEHTRFVELYDKYPKPETLSLGDLAHPGPLGKVKEVDTGSGREAIAEGDIEQWVEKGS
jgi:hypothetical protein